MKMAGCREADNSAFLAFGTHLFESCRKAILSQSRLNCVRERSCWTLQGSLCQLEILSCLASSTRITEILKFLEDLQHLHSSLRDLLCSTLQRVLHVLSFTPAFLSYYDTEQERSAGPPCRCLKLWTMSFLAVRQQRTSSWLRSPLDFEYL